MASLRQADVVEALDVVGEAAASGAGGELGARILPRLRRLLRADVASFSGWDGAAQLWAFDPGDALHPVSDGEVASRAAEHPVVSHMARTRDGRATRVSDLIGLRAFKRLAIYEDRFRPIGANYQILAGLAFGGAVPSGVGFSRASRDFGERERALLDLMRPRLAAAYRSVVEREETRRVTDAYERGLEQAGTAIALVQDGRLVPVSQGAAALLVRWFGEREPALPVAAAVARDDLRLSVTVADGDPAVAVLVETRTCLDPERARALGLTRREAEILALVSRGLSDSALAQELYLSVRTVEKHLQHAYRKLGVASRRDAVARVLAA